jgi:hypothetical protein
VPENNRTVILKKKIGIYTMQNKVNPKIKANLKA